MTVSATSISIDTVPNDGGYALSIFGQFEVGTEHRVHIGLIGKTTDPVAYAGQGQGTQVFPFSSTELKVFTPLLPLLGPHDVLVVQVDSGLTSELRGVLTAVAPDFKSLVFETRRIMPPFYRTGARNMEFVDPIDPILAEEFVP